MLCFLLKISDVYEVYFKKVMFFVKKKPVEKSLKKVEPVRFRCRFCMYMYSYILEQPFQLSLHIYIYIFFY